MLDEVNQKLQESKEYCISKCVKTDEITGKTVPDEEARQLYNEAFAKITTNITAYGNSLNFDTMFQTIVVNNMVLADDNLIPIPSQWKLFGGTVYTKILNTPKEDFFTGLDNTSKVDEFANEITQSIGTDASARRNDLSSKLKPKLVKALDKAFSPEHIEKLSKKAREKINGRIQKIFYDGKMKEIIQDYKLDVKIPSFLPID